MPVRFDPWGCINTHSLKITDKWHCALCPANGQTIMWLRWSPKMVFLSPVKDVKVVSSVSTFVPNSGLEILASQWTISRPTGDLNTQLFVLPVRFTIHIRSHWKWNKLKFHAVQLFQLLSVCSLLLFNVEFWSEILDEMNCCLQFLHWNRH